MNKKKPDFITYIKHQNKVHYKITGHINDCKQNCFYTEIGFAKNKCVIDTILLFLYQTVILFSCIFITNPYNQLYSQLFYSKITSGKLMESILFTQLTSIVIILFVIVVVPILMKMVRAILGLRWFFIRFKKTDNKNHEYNVERQIKYISFYNNYISFASDRVFYRDNKKIKEMKLKDNDIAKRMKYGIVKNVYHFLLMVLLFYSVLFADYRISLSGFLVIVYISLMLLYLLSHVFTCFLWRHYLKTSE